MNSVCQLTRRSLLRSALTGIGATALAPIFGGGSVAVGQSSVPGRGRNLVLVNLLGGIDGLAAFPLFRGAVGEELNRSLRPSLAVPFDSVIPHGAQAGVSDALGFHPAWEPLVRAARSRIKLVQGYGIPNISQRSHDVCQTLTSLGATRASDVPGAVGILPRLVDRLGWQSSQYWVFSVDNPSDLNPTKVAPRVVKRLSDLELPAAGWEEEAEVAKVNQYRKSLLQLEADGSGRPDRFSKGASGAIDLVATVRRDIDRQGVGDGYRRSPVGESLKSVAKVIKAKRASLGDLDARSDSIFLVGQGGYDTHADQVNRQAAGPTLVGLISDLATNLAVLYRDLEQFGVLDDSVIVLYSEFGRTVRQNAPVGKRSVGSDHGRGNNVMVLGGPVTAGVIGEPPSLRELSDVRYNAILPKIDFRDLFGEVIRWLGVEPQELFSGSGYQVRRLGIL